MPVGRLRVCKPYSVRARRCAPAFRERAHTSARGRDGKVTPPPPGPSKRPDVRYLDTHESDAIDETRLANWLRQVAALPGWAPQRASASRISAIAFA